MEVGDETWRGEYVQVTTEPKSHKIKPTWKIESS